ncbi:hypothetical protein CMK11_04255 [Candidatus Poribacteria bacterium]|nr:hypothetical protein [Candidatus Poribacteria bacterium]
MGNRAYRAFVVLVVATALATPYATRAEIIGAWLFDEGSGATTEDATGQQADGDLIGGADWDTGRFGGGILFDGSTGHVEIPDPDQVLITPQMTAMAWVRFESVAGNHSILEQYDWAGDLGAYAFRSNGAALQCYVIWGVDAPVAQGGALEVDVWTHCAFSYDADMLRIYQDGEQVGELAIANGDLNPSLKSLSVGVRGDTKDVHWMAGAMDEVALFDTALSEDEISAIATTDASLAATVLAVDAKAKAAVVWATLRSGVR